jgi:Spy/CpxP family protein refolding chaperone
MTTLVRIAALLVALAPSLARAGSDPAFAPDGGPPPGVMRVGMGSHFHGPMPFGDDPGLMLPMLLQGVGLTDDQKKQVRDIMKADHATLFGLFEQLRTANQALADKLVSAGPLTQQDLQPLVDQVMKVRGDIVNHGLKVVLQVRGLLTADQLAKAADVETKMRALRAQMRQLLGEPEAIPLGEPD